MSIYGTYDGCVTVDKTLNLIGESRDGVIVDGGGTVDCFCVAADYVSIDTFTIINGWFHGIIISGYSDNVITNCNIHNGGYGIHLTGSSNNNFIDCDVYNFDMAYGMYIGTSPNNNFIDCKVHDNAFGFNLDGSPGCNFINCEAWNNDGYGISLVSSSNSDITGCDLHDNDNAGINIMASSDVTVTDCDVHDNNNGIYLTWGSDNNLIYHNNLVGNTQNGYDQGHPNQWDDGIGEGNYWDDYTGVDGNGDGIGDTPYLIPYQSGNDQSQDNYPLMAPYSPPALIGDFNSD
ncbi:MAG: right-handed parallel beta-helix repeat-containing protein, partial [Candidatus Celaenobacter polaris]|nr:right-handed parallel beta-helix repeat-containing protein [Candidatus Celaenobacter polaris]